MSDIEWLGKSGSWPSEPVEGEPIGRPIVDIEHARGLIVGPDEVLVVVFPQWLGQHELNAHSTRLREVLGNRFIAVSGGDVKLAKIKKDDWG